MSRPLREATTYLVLAFSLAIGIATALPHAGSTVLRQAQPRHVEGKACQFHATDLVLHQSTSIARDPVVTSDNIPNRSNPSDGPSAMVLP